MMDIAKIMRIFNRATKKEKKEKKKETIVRLIHTSVAQVRSVSMSQV
jgi:hypothetical protein